MCAHTGSEEEAADDPNWLAEVEARLEAGHGSEAGPRQQRAAAAALGLDGAPDDSQAVDWLAGLEATFEAVAVTV